MLLMNSSNLHICGNVVFFSFIWQFTLAGQRIPAAATPFAPPLDWCAKLVFTHLWLRRLVFLHLAILWIDWDLRHLDECPCYPQGYCCTAAWTWHGCLSLPWLASRSSRCYPYCPTPWLVCTACIYTSVVTSSFFPSSGNSPWLASRFQPLLPLLPLPLTGVHCLYLYICSYVVLYSFIWRFSELTETCAIWMDAPVTHGATAVLLLEFGTVTRV